MSWFWLIIAGFFEVFWAVGLKLSNGFTNIFTSILTIAGMIASFYFLALALKNIPLGSAYAIWTGIGTIGTAIIGILIFKEPVSAIRISCIVLVIAGIAGLKLTA